MNNTSNGILPTAQKQSYRWLRIGLFILLGIITPFALFYMSYYSSSIEQQQVRYFRSLQELEGAVDQTIRNLPSIHKKGVISDTELLKGRIEELESNKKAIEERYKKIKNENLKVTEENKKSKQKWFLLNEKIQLSTPKLKMKHYKGQGNLDSQGKYIFSILKQIKLCRESLVESIDKPNVFLSKLQGLNCRIIPYQYRESLSSYVKVIERQKLILGELAATNKSESTESRKSLNYGSSIKNLNNIISEAKSELRNKLKGCDLTNLSTELSLTNHNFNIAEQIASYAKLNEFLTKFVPKLKGHKEKIQQNIASLKGMKCIDIRLDKVVESLVGFYQEVIEFWNGQEVKDYLALLKKFEDLDAEIKKSASLNGKHNIEENHSHPNNEKLGVLDKQKKIIDEKLLNASAKRDSKEKERQATFSSFRMIMESIKQTLGFENLKIINAAHGDEPCKQLGSNNIINVITPKVSGRGMVLMTLDERDDSTKQHIHISVPFDDVINAQVSTLPVRFDQVLISDEKGKVYYLSSRQHFGEKIQLGRFQYNPFAYDFIGYQNVKDIIKRVDNKLIQIEKLEHVNSTQKDKDISSLSHMALFSVGDKEFRAFVQPMHLPVTYCNAGKEEEPKSLDNEPQWYLIGVINEDRFQKTALAAPPIIVAGVILMMVIVIALLPFLKTVLADKHTLLTKHLRTLVVWSLGVVCSFLILLLCLYISNYVLGIKNKIVVKQLNSEINEQFNLELANKLRAFEWQQSILKDSTEKELPLKCLDDLNKSIKNNHLPFYTFIILNEEGRHAGLINSIKKLAINKKASLKNRLYYKNALKGNMWQIETGIDKTNIINSWPDSCGEKPAVEKRFKEIYIQRIISYLDGQRETIISSVISNEHSDQRVTVLDVRFDTFFRRVLPLHTSFAVVENNTGKVLYHSTPERALVENFIDEADGATALIAKLYHQKKGELSLTYQGKSIQAYTNALLVEKNSGQVLWQLITYKVLDFDEQKLLVTTLTAAAILLVISALFFIILEVFTFCFNFQSIVNIERPQVSQKAANKAKYCVRKLLSTLFLLVMVFSACSFYVVLATLEQASQNYEFEHKKNAIEYRKQGYKNIYKRLKLPNPLVADSESMIVPPLEVIDDGNGDLFLLPQRVTSSLLKYILPVISYTTGALAENLKVLERWEFTENKLYLQSFLLQPWQFFILFILILFIVKAILLAVNLVAKNLYDEVDLTARLVTGAPPTNEIRNKILLLIEPEQLSECIKKHSDELVNSSRKVVTINTADSLLLCEHYYPEGSVIFITDFASIVLKGENSHILLSLLESFATQHLQIIMATNIVPSYWLEMQEQRIEYNSYNDTGIAVELYRWSQVLEKFDVIAKHSSTVSYQYSQYFKQWALCSFEEQSVLVSLADNNLVNRHNVEAIESLLYKGLIEQDDSLIFQRNLRIKDSGFICFIVDHYHKSSLDTWQKQGKGQLWTVILPIILVISILMVVFVVTTGAEALQYSLSIIAALVATIPTLSAILGFFKNK